MPIALHEPVELALPLLLRLLSPADDVGEPERCCLAGSARRFPNPSPKLCASSCGGGIDELVGAVAPSSKKPSASEGVGDDGGGAGRAGRAGRGDAADAAAAAAGSAAALEGGGPTFGIRGASRMGMPILATPTGTERRSNGGGPARRRCSLSGRRGDTGSTRRDCAARVLN